MKHYRTACAWRARVLGRGYVSLPIKQAVIEMEYRAWRGVAGYHALDCANALSATKAAVDALVDAEIIVNDSKARLQWGGFRLLTTRREIEREGKQPGVTVIVRAA